MVARKLETIINIKLKMEKEGCFYRQPFELMAKINLLERFQDQWMGIHERDVMKWMVEIKS